MADSNYKGVVSKTYPSRFGGSFGLNGQTLYFNTKGPLPAFIRPGVTVEFSGFLGRNGKSFLVNDDTLKEVAGAPPPATSSGVSSFDSRNASIVYQSSRKDALAMVEMLLENGAVKLPAQQSKIAGVIEALVDRFTALYYDDVEALGALDRAGPPPAAEKSAPADDEGLPE